MLDGRHPSPESGEVRHRVLIEKFQKLSGQHAELPDIGLQQAHLVEDGRRKRPNHQFAGVAGSPQRVGDAQCIHQADAGAVDDEIERDGKKLAFDRGMKWRPAGLERA